MLFPEATVPSESSTAAGLSAAAAAPTNVPDVALVSSMAMVEAEYDRATQKLRCRAVCFSSSLSCLAGDSVESELLSAPDAAASLSHFFSFRSHNACFSFLLLADAEPVVVCGSCVIKRL